MTELREWRRATWFWPAVASLILLALLSLLSEEVKYGMFSANLAAASFLAMVGIGQMFPIATGEGGIDLSIPFVMNFAAFLAVRLITDSAASVVIVLLAAICFGMLVGIVNGTVVQYLRVPPIIGTLAVGFVILSLVQMIAASGSTTISNRTVVDLVRGSVIGIPTPFWVVALIGAAVGCVVGRTPYGRTLQAVGQSRRAAYLAGLPITRTITIAYVVSAVLAGVSGVMLAASVGSADLELGNPFLLTSVGAVVLGGNRISGGTASAVGTFFGALLLTLLVAAVTVAGFPIEVKNIVSGLVITIVLMAANAPEMRSRLGRFPRLRFRRDNRGGG